MTCRGCSKEFTPQKSFHSYCSSCFPLLARCGVCQKAVYPVNGKYSCCGVTESKAHITEANRPSRMRGRSLSDMIFILEHNQTPEQMSRDMFPEDYNDDIPNS